MLKSPNGSSIVPLCYKFKIKSKGTPQFLVAQDHHREHHRNILSASVIMFPWLPKHQDLQNPFPKPASQLNKTHAVTGLQETALNGVQLERTKIGKAFIPLQVLPWTKSPCQTYLWVCCVLSLLGRESLEKVWGRWGQHTWVCSQRSSVLLAAASSWILDRVFPAAQ